MALTKEQLLVKRVKVIAAWPGMETKYFAVSDIITDEINSKCVDQFGNYIPRLVWADYPHLFQPLQWWSDRKLDDLPDYVKYDDNSYMMPVTRIAKCSLSLFKADGFTSINFEPSDLTEYKQYLTQQTSK